MRAAVVELQRRVTGGVAVRQRGDSSTAYTFAHAATPSSRDTARLREHERGRDEHQRHREPLHPSASSASTGSRRIRLPVTAKIAPHSAGATGGTPGSPMPLGSSSLATAYVSIAGHSYIRSAL